MVDRRHWVESRLSRLSFSLQELETIMALWSRFRPLGHEDLDDALTCLSWRTCSPQTGKKLDAPDEYIAPNEGWIWVPKDVIVKPCFSTPFDQ